MLTAGPLTALRSKVAHSFKLLDTLVESNKTCIKKHEELRKRQSRPTGAHAHLLTCNLPPTETEWTEEREGKAKLRSQKKNNEVLVLHYSNWIIIFVTSLCKCTLFFERRIYVSQIKSFL